MFLDLSRIFSQFSVALQRYRLRLVEPSLTLSLMVRVRRHQVSARLAFQPLASPQLSSHPSPPPSTRHHRSGSVHASLSTSFLSHSLTSEYPQNSHNPSHPKTYTHSNTPSYTQAISPRITANRCTKRRRSSTTPNPCHNTTRRIRQISRTRRLRRAGIARNEISWIWDF